MDLDLDAELVGRTRSLASGAARARPLLLRSRQRWSGGVPWGSAAGRRRATSGDRLNRELLRVMVDADADPRANAFQNGVMGLAK